MNNVRTVAAAIVALALSATGALATVLPPQAPTNAAAVSATAQDTSIVGGTKNNHGGAVSTIAKTINDEPATTTDTAPTTDTTVTTDAGGVQGAHGAAVSAVAQDATAVGGTNNNHGGAVSAVARGTHGPSDTHGPSATHGNSTDKSQAGAQPTTH